MYFIVLLKYVFAKICLNFIEKRKPVIGASQLKFEALDAQNVICIDTRADGSIEYTVVHCAVAVIGRYATHGSKITPYGCRYISYLQDSPYIFLVPC